MIKNRSAFLDFVGKVFFNLPAFSSLLPWNMPEPKKNATFYFNITNFSNFLPHIRRICLPALGKPLLKHHVIADMRRNVCFHIHINSRCPWRASRNSKYYLSAFRCIFNATHTVIQLFLQTQLPSRVRCCNCYTFMVVNVKKKFKKKQKMEICENGTAMQKKMKHETNKNNGNIKFCYEACPIFVSISYCCSIIRRFLSWHCLYVFY